MSQATIQLLTLEQVEEAIASVVRRELGFMVRETQHAKTVFTSKETAEYLSMSPSTLAHWRTEGRGPVYSKEGKRVHYLKKDIDTWVSENRVMTAELTA